MRSSVLVPRPMRGMLFGIGAWGLIVAPAVTGGSRADTSPLADLAGDSEPDSLFLPLETALRTASLDWSDFDLPISGSLTDVFRLAVVDAVLDRPWAIDTVVGEVVGTDSAAAIAPLLERAASELATMDVGPESTPVATPSPSVDVALEVLGMGLEVVDAPDSQRDFLRAIAEPAFEHVSTAPRIDSSLVDDAMTELFADDDEDAAELSPFEIREAEREAMRVADRFYARAETVDVSAIVRDAAALLARWEHAWRGLDGTEDWVPVRVETELGAVVVSGPESDRHERAPLILVDLGGNDVVIYSGAPARVSGVFDVAGDDTYRSGDGPGGPAAGVGGVGAVFDRSGDDVYHAGDVGLGAGVLGVGVLVDDAGDDLYLADRFAQGAGFLGAGVLVDREGHDTYRMASYGQGYGYVGGIGVLRDLAGGDRYLFAPRYTDVIRYDDHYISFLQGSALGHRPDRSGGIGILVDDAGNDLYDCDIYGQGSAYWFSLAALWDKSGHDVYAGYQYSQGAGVHLAAAMLRDDDGEDVYRARGVSQGTGHDLAFGALVDRAGNDTFVTDDLGQGAGNANGIGVLVDHSGGDSYVQARSNTLGYGNSRRGSGSVGLFVDVRGSDRYALRGGDGTLLTAGRVGLGLDAPNEMTAEETWPADPKIPVEERAYTDDELFVLASTAPPKYSTWRDHALDEFEARGTDAMPSLLRHLGSRIARERHGFKDVMMRIGEAAVPHLAAAVDTAEAEARRHAVWSMGFVGAGSAIDVLEPLLDDADEEMRASAAMAIARTARTNEEARAAVNADRLIELARSEARNTRRAALFAIGSLERPETVDVLVRGLDDPFVGVRITAADQLVRLGAAALDALDDRLSNDGPGRVGALQTLGRIDDDHARALLVDAVPETSNRWTIADRTALAFSLEAQRKLLDRAEDASVSAKQQVAGALRALAASDDWQVRGAVSSESSP